MQLFTAKRVPSQSEARVAVKTIGEGEPFDYYFDFVVSELKKLGILCTNPRLMCLQGSDARTIQA